MKLTDQEREVILVKFKRGDSFYYLATLYKCKVVQIEQVIREALRVQK